MVSNALDSIPIYHWHMFQLTPYLNLIESLWSKVDKRAKLHVSIYRISFAQTRRVQKLSYFLVPIVYLK